MDETHPVAVVVHARCIWIDESVLPRRMGGYSLCSFSGEPHQVLCGLATKKGSHGTWVTEQANRYLADLRTLIAGLFSRACRK